MEDHPSTILDHWPFPSREKTIEELTQSLWTTTMELEATKVRVQEEIRARDDQFNQLNDLLTDVINERNEARNKYQSLLLDKLLHKHSVEDEHITNYGFSFSDCEESIVSSSPPVEAETAIQLPEKGKFLEAVMKAGPLLQNLLLAGPLPHWRHPPPQLDTYQIPSPRLVIAGQYLVPDNCFEFTKKRGFSEDSDSSTETKYRKVYLN